MRAHGAIIWTLLLLTSQSALADTYFLLRGETICDRTEALCIRGTLRYEQLFNLISFQGRVQKTTEPGRVTLRLRGTTPANLYAVVELRFDVRGNYSEIIDQKMTTGYPAQTEWEISGLFYEPNEKHRDPER